MALPREWREADILSLIDNGVKESIELDYKQCDSLQKTEGRKREIGKDVSAFANSAGGTIVYGVAEDKHVPTAIDAGYDPADITKEWLEHVINSHIQPRLERFYINQVELTTTRPGKVLYVVEIPQATTRAPHQASDNRYYKRFNFESVPMEDYEVRDALHRQQGPDLMLKLTRIPALQLPSLGVPGTTNNHIGLSVQVENRSRVDGKYVMCICWVTTNDYQVSPLPGGVEHQWTIVRGNARMCQYATSNRVPVYSDLPLDAPSLLFRPSIEPPTGAPLILEFSLYAEGMRGKQFQATIPAHPTMDPIEVIEVTT